MKTKLTFGEVLLRLFFAFYFLFSPIAPTVTALAASMAQTQDKRVEDGLLTPLTKLPAEKLITFDPPYPEPDFDTLRTSPEPDTIDKTLPPEKIKSDIEFSLIPTSNTVTEDEPLALTVVISNNSTTDLVNLSFMDELEEGFSYIDSDHSDLIYESSTKTVSIDLGTLPAGELVSFEYTISIDAGTNGKNLGKVWVHTAELTHSDSQSGLKAKTLIRVDKERSSNPNKLDYIDADGGWVEFGNTNVFFPPNTITQQGVVEMQKVVSTNTGPEYQFSLELIQLDNAEKQNGKLKEQKVDIKHPWKGNFLTQAFIEIDFSSFADLENLPADITPYVATFDQEHEVWVKVPILDVDKRNNKVTVKAKHFSVWGAGLGASFPENGTNMLLFDQPYTSLFTGGAQYSIPIWTPPGRIGMQPSIALSYSSKTVDGVTGDVQSSWVGTGWNIDGVEIVRKIETNEQAYGYLQEYALTINGTLYDLIRDEYNPNRYYTKRGSFLYIERHNPRLGNEGNVGNQTGEWWEVVATDGTRYRLGYNLDSEQVTLMAGYSCSQGNPCNTPDGAYASSGYAGIADDLVAMRWRVDKITDTHGNYIEYTYFEEREDPVTTTLPIFDRASYLETIRYTGFRDLGDSGHLDPGYQVVFFRENKDTSLIPTDLEEWEHYDSFNLSSIEVYQCKVGCDVPGGQVGDQDNLSRAYDFGYSILSSTYQTKTNYSLVLTDFRIADDNAPKVSFAYSLHDNRDSDSGTQNPWKYPRLEDILNGYEGKLVYIYENDGREPAYWYDWRVKQAEVFSDTDSSTKAGIQGYQYSDPIYDDGDVVGYEVTKETSYELNGTTKIVEVEHNFGAFGLDVGRELETDVIDPATSTILRRTQNVYVTDNSHAPFYGWNFRYLGQTRNYKEINGQLSLTTKTSFIRDGYSGNLVAQFDYLGNELNSQHFYEYYLNPDADIYIMDKVAKSWVLDASDFGYAYSLYHYDGKLFTEPTVGELVLVQTLTGETVSSETYQTVDFGYAYDIFGNTTDTYAYTNFGSTKIDETYRENTKGTLFNPATGDSQHTTSEYDSTYHTYQTKVTDPLGHYVETIFDTSLGVPTSVTDFNSITTGTTYDSLGRIKTVTIPGSSTVGVEYFYPSPDGTSGEITAPYSIKMKIYDPQGDTDRPVWAFYDGIGRAIQDQVYIDPSTNKLFVTDTAYDARGQVYQQSVGHEVTASGGTFQSPDFSIKTETSYDLLGRPTLVTAPGGQTTQTDYDGLTRTITNANGQDTTQVMDGFGRLIQVMEKIDGGNSVYESTFYTYDPVGRLVEVLDTQLNTTVIQYDWLGRKTHMQDPDMGIWTYEYNPMGSLIQQTDAVGQVLEFEYDSLNRLERKVDTSANPDVTLSEYYYDTKYDGSVITTDTQLGYRTKMTDQTGTTYWTYTANGRTVTETREINSQSYTMKTVTDWLGRVESISYPDNEIVTYSYDAMGRATNFESDSITTQRSENDYLAELAYNAMSQVTDVTLGNNAVISNTYAASGTDIFRLENRTVNSNSQSLLDFDYTYDAQGNITEINDYVQNEDIIYEYDDLNRLISAEAMSGTDTVYSEDYHYDQLGNITNWVQYVEQHTGYDLFNRLVESTVSNAGPAAVIRRGLSINAPPIPASMLAGNQEEKTPEVGNSVSDQHAFDGDEFGSYGDNYVVNKSLLALSTDIIFSDGFESGDFANWSASVVDNGDLSVITGAAYEGTYGMMADVNDTNPMYVLDSSPTSEQEYLARFYFNPNSIDLYENWRLKIVGDDPDDVVTDSFSVMLQETSPYSLLIYGLDDNNTQITSGLIDIGNDWMMIEVEFKAASSDGADDGYIKLWVDGTLAGSLLDLDNDTKAIDNIYLGAMGVDSNDLGSIYFDSFESRVKAIIEEVPPNPIFVDDFEVGSLSNWSALVTDGGDLSTTIQSAYEGKYGMEAVIDDETAIYVEDSTPDLATEYHARFYFNPNNIDLDGNWRLKIFGDDSDNVVTESFSVMLQETDPYSLILYAKDDVGNVVSCNPIDIFDNWVIIEIEFKTSSGIGANDGFVKLWVNGTIAGSLLDLDNDTKAIDNIYLGAMGVDTNDLGSIYFDNFESHTQNFIGGEVPPPDLIFDDDFEIDDSLQRWSSSVTDGSDLSRDISAQYEGSYGAKVSLDDTNDQYLQDNKPNDVEEYRVSFFLDPNSATIADNGDGVDERFTLIQGHDDTISNAFTITMEAETPYALILMARTDSGGWIVSDRYNIGDAWSEIELKFTSSTAPGANNGQVILWVDGEIALAHSGIDNDTIYIDSVQIGAMGVDAGSSGAFYIDDYKSREKSPLTTVSNNWGTGEDGDLSISTTFNLNTDGSGGSRNGASCPDAAAYSVTNLTVGYAELNQAPGSCLLAGDEILLVNLQGTQSDYINVGHFEFLTVGSINSSTVTFSVPKRLFYGAGEFDDNDVGIGTDQQRVMLMRVPNYNSVNIASGGMITAEIYDHYKYGVLAFRVAGTLTGVGNITMSGRGYSGGGGGTEQDSGFGVQGESFTGLGERSSVSNAGGGAGGHPGSGDLKFGKGGGGGGYANNGTNSYFGSPGGIAYGLYSLDRLYLGSGGGGGGRYSNDGVYTSGDVGGKGGGAVFIAANTIDLNAIIASNGGDSSSSSAGNRVGEGGGGAGGSIRVEFDTLINAEFQAVEGESNDNDPWNSVENNGGDGAEGRIALIYEGGGPLPEEPEDYSADPDAYVGTADQQEVIPTYIGPNNYGIAGSGADGNLVVSVGEVVDLTKDSPSMAHSCTNGGEAASYNVIHLKENYLYLVNSPGEGCLKPGDEFMLINVMGAESSYPNVGQYEFIRVGSVDQNLISFASVKAKNYGSGLTNDSDIGVGLDQQRVLLVRVPNYDNVTVNGTLTGFRFYNNNNGALVFRIKGELNGSGSINMNGKGYSGGLGGDGDIGAFGEQGDSIYKEGSVGAGAANYGGGGAGKGTTDGVPSGGGGGGYGTAGEDSGGTGQGGISYGEETLAKLYLGSGGGGGGGKEATQKDGGFGARGGGILAIFAEKVNFSGTIASAGYSATDSSGGDGGGGAGGSVLLYVNDLTNLNTLYAPGGSAHQIGSESDGGDGGDGRVAIYCATLDVCNLPAGYLGYLDYYDSDNVFKDGFELDLDTSDGLDGWSSIEEITGTSISVVPEADYAGNYGLEFDLGTGVTYDGSQAVRISETYGAGYLEYHVLFYLNPNGVVVGDDGDGADERFNLLTADDAVNGLSFGISMQGGGSASHALRLIARTQDAGGWLISDPVVIDDHEWTEVAMVYRASSAPGMDDGYIRLYLNGSQAAYFVDINNDIYHVDVTSLGAMGVDSSSSGSFYVDNYETRRFSVVEGLADPGVEPPNNPPIDPDWLENTYTYDELHPHAVSAVVREQVGGGTVTDTFEYDANGNMTCRVENGVTWVQEYNQENRLSKVRQVNGDCSDAVTTDDDQTWTFYYDGNGVRIKEEYDDDPSTTTTFTTRLFLFGGSYEVDDNGTTTTIKKYYSIAGMRIAMDDGSDLFYFATDHLSSSSVVMSGTGALLSENRYMPFGEVRDIDGNTEITETDFGFTGQRNYSYMQLIDYHARFYSPTLGRFIQPDTIIPDLTNSQAWNRYSYSYNNPLYYTDPSGHIPEYECGFHYSGCGTAGELPDNSDSGGGGISDQPGDIDEDVQQEDYWLLPIKFPAGLKLPDSPDDVQYKFFAVPNTNKLPASYIWPNYQPYQGGGANVFILLDLIGQAWSLAIALTYDPDSLPPNVYTSVEYTYNPDGTETISSIETVNASTENLRIVYNVQGYEISGSGSYTYSTQTVNEMSQISIVAGESGIVELNQTANIFTVSFSYFSANPNSFPWYLTGDLPLGTPLEMIDFE